MYAELEDLFASVDEEFEPIVPRLGRRKKRSPLEKSRGQRRKRLAKSNSTIAGPLRARMTAEQKAAGERGRTAKAKIGAGWAQRKQSPRNIKPPGYKKTTEAAPSSNPVHRMQQQVAKLTSPGGQVRSFRPNPVGFALASDGQRRAKTQETASKRIESPLLNYTNTMSAVYAAEQQRRQSQAMEEEARDKRLGEQLQVAEAKTTDAVQEEADFLQRDMPQGQGAPQEQPLGQPSRQQEQQARSAAEEQRRAEASATTQREQEQARQLEAESLGLYARSSGGELNEAFNPMDYFDSSNAYSSPFNDPEFGDPWGRSAPTLASVSKGGNNISRAAFQYG